MSTADLIQRYYNTFNGGDREALLDLLADDVAHDINQGDTEEGKAAFRAFLKKMDHSYAEQVQDLVIMTSNFGTHAAAEFYIQGTYLKTDEGLPPATGQTYRLRVGAFFDVRDGLIFRVTNYYNLNKWLRMVGGEE